MTDRGTVYIAAAGGLGEWTPLGYLDAGEALMPSVDATLTWTGDGYLVVEPATPDPPLRLDPDDGRDQPRLPDVSGLKLPPQPGAPVAIATTDLIRYLVHGIYRQCAACAAPVISPFPAGWRMELAYGEDRRMTLTPHRPDCQAEQVGVDVPAAYVHDLTLDFGRWAGEGGGRA